MNITPEEAKASLGIATHLQGLLMPQAPEAPQTQEMGQEQAQPQQPQETAPPEPQAPQMADLELMFSTKLDDLRKEMKADQQREMDVIKNEIKSALDESN